MKTYKEKLLKWSDYPSDWKLSEKEKEEILNLCLIGLKTTNGDLARITLTARQVLLLLREEFNYGKQ